MENEPYIGKEEIVKKIWQAKAVELRDVPLKVTNDEVEKLPLDNQPFLYASGNWGMGYITIKGLVGFSELFESMIGEVAKILKKAGVKFDFVSGLMTGGVIPGYRLSQLFEVPFVPFMYLEGTRKKENISAKVIDHKRLEKICEDIVHDVFSDYHGAADIIEDYIPRLIAGAAPRGMIPGFRVAQMLSEKLKHDVPFVYIRKKPKKGGKRELITGDKNSPNISKGYDVSIVGEEKRKDFEVKAVEKAGLAMLEHYNISGYAKLDEGNDFEVSLDENNSLIPPGSKGIVIEELVNFAGSTGNAALWLRDRGYTVEDSATILTYENPEAIQRLKEMGVRHHYFTTLTELLDIGEKHKCAKSCLVQEYRGFLKDPLKWQAKRGLTPIERGGTV